MAVFNSSGTSTYSFSDLSNGNKLIQGFRIFKAGTFRDSLGLQQTWDVEHLHQMVSNFKALVSKGIFTDVPVRTDHSFSIKDVVGYIRKLSVDDTFLLADYEFTEVSAFEALQRGTYRARSAEIGMFETNNEQFYWPVVHGFAFVDIPAVEGLYRGSDSVSCFSAVDTKEPIVPDPVTPPTPPATPPADAGARPPAAAPTTFRVNGTSVTDAAEVQTYIDRIEADNKALAAFQTEITQMSRATFVDDLAKANKVTQPQVEGLKALAQTMTPEQFTAFKATYESAPVHSLLGDHANGVTNPAGDTKPTAAEDNLEVLKGRVEMFRRTGMSEEEIAKTPSARQLAAITAAAK